MTHPETGVQQIKALLVWLSDSNWRWFGLFTFGLWLLLASSSAAVRYSWRMGYAEPGSRLQYALTSTFADSLLTVSAVIAVLAIGAPAYRLWRWRRNA